MSTKTTFPSCNSARKRRIKLNAYPDRPLTGRISDIGPILDPSLRTAKVRIEVANPGFLKLGMFATATFTSRDQRDPRRGSRRCRSSPA